MKAVYNCRCTDVHADSVVYRLRPVARETTDDELGEYMNIHGVLQTVKDATYSSSLLATQLGSFRMGCPRFATPPLINTRTMNVLQNRRYH